MNRDDEELPTEEELIALARLTIFRDVLKRKKENDAIQEEEAETGKTRPN